ncbi:MAG: MotA/TolQ/ExbB proton channel family protein [Planctomycetaceae bacterium]|nr:MotA/TolQ/ExbB proton channel family protein [Planctomycetaceae bacterium]
MRAACRSIRWAIIASWLLGGVLGISPLDAEAFQELPPTRPPSRAPLPAAEPAPVGKAPAAPANAGSVKPPAATPGGNPSETFVGWMLRASGIVGFLIGVLSFVMMALIVLQLQRLRRSNFVPAGFLEDFERLLEERNYQGAYDAARSNDSFVGKVLAGGMSRVPRGYDAAVKGMEAVADEEILEMEQSIGYIALIGSVAPMLGLIGTVQGMAITFQVFAASVTSPRTAQLADGIGMALFTTLEGLVVAIPAMICCTVFRNRLARFVLEAGAISDELMKRFQGAPKSPAAMAPRSTPSQTLAPPPAPMV